MIKKVSLLGLAGALVLAAAAVPGMLPRMARAAGRRPLGLQLFTVMVDLERDFAGTLAAVSAIGYREVETIGAFGRDPTWVREQLDKAGLTSPSQHLVPGDLYDVFNRFTHREMAVEEVKRRWMEVMSPERVEPIIDEGAKRAQVLGQKYIAWQIIWPEQMATRAELDNFCKAMNRAGDICSAAGLTFCFHNHSDEFAKKDGYVPYDVIIESTDPARVKFELDFYWATKGGADPADYFRRYPGRFVQCHLKDSTAAGDFATVGKGIVDFPKLIAAARSAGIEHFYVEYDRSDDPMRAVRESWDYLKPLF
jgi:sugar phosphate isomerase/epimerase